jgi:hypothetical protein
MTVQAESDTHPRAWIDPQYLYEAKPNAEQDAADEASMALAKMALGAVNIAVLFALCLAVWAGGPLAFTGLLHDMAAAARWVASFFGWGL